MPKKKKKPTAREKFQAGIRKAFSGVGLKTQKQKDEERKKREKAYLESLE